MVGPKTLKNLQEAFAGESKARNKYDYFASLAKKEGYVQISNFFSETALNEKEHAKMWAKLLGLPTTTAEALKEAAAGELYENLDMYPRMAAEALEEGHADIARLFNEVAAVEKAHETRYEKLLLNLEKAEVFKRAEIKKWKCTNCGHIHEGEGAPSVCPTCSHPQAYFEIFVENY